jgi:hypothetical protein
MKMLRPSEFVVSICSLSFPNTFNPYSGHCIVHDKPNAAKKRSSTLSAILNEAAKREVDAIWIGRDLGYRGGRRTGLALTDDVHMQSHAQRWGLDLERPTIGEPVAERTAAVIWSILKSIDSPIFLWNVFPLHPHEPEMPFSNRAHNSKERRVGEDILSTLIALIRPKRVIAIGNDAARSAHHVASSKNIFQVRHPSYGGQTEFLSQMRSLYNLSGLSP